MDDNMKDTMQTILEDCCSQLNEKKMDIFIQKLKELNLMHLADSEQNFSAIKGKIEGDLESYFYNDGIKDVRIITFKLVAPEQIPIVDGKMVVQLEYY